MIRIACTPLVVGAIGVALLAAIGIGMARQTSSPVHDHSSLWGAPMGDREKGLPHLSWRALYDFTHVRDVPPLAPRLAVFARPRRASDSPPEEVVRSFKTYDVLATDGISNELDPGRVDLGEARLLFEVDLRGKIAPFYAAPTQNGWVCYEIGDVTSNCVRDLTTRSISAAIDDISEGRAWLVHGLVGDDVETLVVHTKAATVAAHVASNGFYALVPPWRGQATVAARMKDGTVDHVAIGP